MNNPVYIRTITLDPKTGRCDASFRQGLNVIVAIDTIKQNVEEDIADIKNHKLEENVIDSTGQQLEEKIRNSVGKTTFINLIDYILGKTEFIDNKDTDVNEFFNDKYVIGEISFHNKKYTIKRNMLDSNDIFVYDGWVREQIVDKKHKELDSTYYDLEKYKIFLNEKIYKDSNLFNSKYYTTHRSIMNFLIRDQYYGFNVFDSGIKSENAQLKKNRLEFLLGIITKDINELELKIEALKDKKADLQNEKDTLSKYFTMKLGNKPNIKLDIKNTDIKSNRLEVDLINLEKDSNNSLINLIELKEERDRLIKCINDIKEKMDIFCSKYENYKLAINDIYSELDKLQNIKTSIDIFTPFGMKKCPYLLKELNGSCEYLDWDDTEEHIKIIDARKKILLYEQSDLRKAIERSLSRYEHMKFKKENLELNINEISIQIDKIEGEYNDKIEFIRNEIKGLEFHKLILKDHLSNYEYINQIQNEIKGKNKDIKETKEIIDNQKINVVGDLNNIFDKIIRYMTNNERIGNINPKNYKPNILFLDTKKIDDGAAMKNLAIIAFDIALLEFSLKSDDEAIHYPRFLIHDSPRKNDLQDWVYFNVFEYIVKLENKYFPKGKYFQYIITTLDLPEDINNKDYIRLTLDNSGEGGKLFGRNIGA